MTAPKRITGPQIKNTIKRPRPTVKPVIIEENTKTDTENK